MHRVNLWKVDSFHSAEFFFFENTIYHFEITLT